MARINGRRIRPSNLQERRLLSSLGCDGVLYVPRNVNPYLAARRLARAARTDSPDMLFLRDVASKAHRPNPPSPFPVDVDTPEPHGNHPVHAEPDGDPA